MPALDPHAVPLTVARASRGPEELGQLQGVHPYDSPARPAHGAPTSAGDERAVVEALGLPPRSVEPPAGSPGLSSLAPPPPSSCPRAREAATVVRAATPAAPGHAKGIGAAAPRCTGDPDADRLPADLPAGAARGLAIEPGEAGCTLPAAEAFKESLGPKHIPMEREETRSSVEREEREGGATRAMLPEERWRDGWREVTRAHFRGGPLVTATGHGLYVGTVGSPRATQWTATRGGGYDVGTDGPAVRDPERTLVIPPEEFEWEGGEIALLDNGGPRRVTL